MGMPGCSYLQPSWLSSERQLGCSYPEVHLNREATWHSRKRQHQSDALEEVAVATQPSCTSFLSFYLYCIKWTDMIELLKTVAVCARKWLRLQNLYLSGKIFSSTPRTCRLFFMKLLRRLWCATSTHFAWEKYTVITLPNLLLCFDKFNLPLTVSGMASSPKH